MLFYEHDSTKLMLRCDVFVANYDVLNAMYYVNTIVTMSSTEQY